MGARRACSAQEGCQSVTDLLGKGQATLPMSLARSNQNAPPHPVDVFNPQPDYFAGP
ncbi:MAG: hypothetical protein ABIZ80_15130 [Bryobacteraceae bacterium]